jgi:hypothetical protein
MNRRLVWLVAGLVLLPLLGIGFLNDDFVGVVHFGPRGWAGMLDAFHPKDFEFLRPLGFLLFRAELSAFGARPWLFHATHLALFALAAWLAGRLAVRLSGPAAAGWAAALALLYPGRTEVVAWVAALFDLLALLLASAALLLATALGWDRNRARAAGLAALCFIAPLAKESAYVIPVVVLAWELLGVLGPAALATRALRCGAAFAGATCAFCFRLLALGGIGGYTGVTPLVSAASKAWKLPEMLARVFFFPVNPTYGLASQIFSVLCFAAATAVVLGFLRGNRRLGTRPFIAGLVLALLGLLPPLPYIDPSNLAWNQSRMLAISGLGVALAAAAALASAPKHWARFAGALLVAAWTATSALNELPWLGAARCRDALLTAIERVTRAPGAHWVWVEGPINDYRGAQLLGGRLAEAVVVAMPKRVIHVDSEFLQELQHRPVGPPSGVPRGALRILRFEPSPLRIVEIGAGAADTPP